MKKDMFKFYGDYLLGTEEQFQALCDDYSLSWEDRKQLQESPLMDIISWLNYTIRMKLCLNVLQNFIRLLCSNNGWPHSWGLIQSIILKMMMINIFSITIRIYLSPFLFLRFFTFS